MENIVGSIAAGAIMGGLKGLGIGTSGIDAKMAEKARSNVKQKIQAIKSNREQSMKIREKGIVIEDYPVGGVK